eukprot:SAG11_NODE_7944_length_1079_cov_0.951020_1_plen_114_part_00
MIVRPVCVQLCTYLCATDVVVQSSIFGYYLSTGDLARGILPYALTIELATANCVTVDYVQSTQGNRFRTGSELCARRSLGHAVHWFTGSICTKKDILDIPVLDPGRSFPPEFV